jgi:hypothetical protein
MVKGLSDFLLMPMLCLFFGLLVFFLGIRKEMDGGKAPWKWAGVLILGIGSYSVWESFALFVGIGDPSDVTGFRDLNGGKKNTLAVITGFVLPVLGIVGCVIANCVFGKRKTAQNE